MQKEQFFRNAAQGESGPLAGTRVIEVATTWAGPMCGCLLADLGADVIKVELPQGEVARHLPPTVQPDGSEIPIPGPAAKFSRTPTRVRSAAPAIGQHAEEILAELGLDSDELSALRAAGAFGSR